MSGARRLQGGETADTKGEFDGARAWYDSVADRFVRRYDGMEGDYYRLFEEDVFVKLAGSDGPILDLGCGHGRFVSRMTAEGGPVTVGADLSLEMLKRGEPNAPLAQANAASLPFADATFATVVSMGMFEYMEDPTPFLAEIHRVLKPGGKLLFTFHQVKDRQGAPKEDDESVYYGRKVKERNSLWTRVVRRLDEVEEGLRAARFTPVAPRRIFFRLPRILFRIGVEGGRFLPPLRSALVGAAKLTENVMASLMSRGADGNTIMFARKNQS
jgi:ubiquinone/menaquinone biosynthesis C-methylase UbiE